MESIIFAMLLFMKKNNKTYTCFQSGSAVFMILALLWLTISAPFAFAGQQELAKLNKNSKSLGFLSPATKKMPPILLAIILKKKPLPAATPFLRNTCMTITSLIITFRSFS